MPSSYMQYLLSSDNEYDQHKVKQKIKEITSQTNITANEIKSKVDAFPDASNIKLLKNSVHLLHKNGLLTKENLALIGNEENFKYSYFSNGILKKLDDVNLINQENLEWTLNATSNILYWNIDVLHKNSQLTPKNLQALKDETVSSELSSCFEHLLLPRKPMEEIPKRFRIPNSKNLISDCSDTFLNFGVNPLTARLPSEFDNSLDVNYSTSLESNLFLANTVLYLISKLFHKVNPPAVSHHSHGHRRIYTKLDKIEKLLIDSLEKYPCNNDKVIEAEIPSSSSTVTNFFSPIAREKNTTTNFADYQKPNL